MHIVTSLLGLIHTGLHDIKYVEQSPLALCKCSIIINSYIFPYTHLSIAYSKKFLDKMSTYLKMSLSLKKLSHPLNFLFTLFFYLNPIWTEKSLYNTFGLSSANFNIRHLNVLFYFICSSDNFRVHKGFDIQRG